MSGLKVEEGGLERGVMSKVNNGLGHAGHQGGVDDTHSRGGGVTPLGWEGEGGGAPL